MAGGRVLVTGASGLIGRPTVAALREAGFDVVALSRSGKAVGPLEVITGDLLEPRSRQRAVAAARASHLLHLAWHDAPKDRWSSGMNTAWGKASVALFKEFAAAGGCRVLGVGSCAEYDWSASVLHETTPLKPASLYGQAKAATGEALLAMAPELGLSAAWARIFFCYGPGEAQGRLMGDLLRGLDAGEEVPCTDGEQARDFLHTGDVGRALAMVLASPLEGAVNIGSGQAIKVRDLIAQTAEQMGRADLIRLGAISRPEGDAAVIKADIGRLSSIGFRPRFDLKSGVRDCIAAFREAGAL